MASTNALDASKTKTAAFTNFVTSSLVKGKLDGSNYNTWAFDIKLWLIGQGYILHSPSHHKGWISGRIKIDTQLCNFIKLMFHPVIKLIFCPHLMCESISDQAKVLYNNYTQPLYGVCHDLICCSCTSCFNGLLLLAASVIAEKENELEQCSPFFILLALKVWLESTLPLVIRFWGLLISRVCQQPLLFSNFQPNPLLSALLPLLLVTQVPLHLKQQLEPLLGKTLQLQGSSQV